MGKVDIEDLRREMKAWHILRHTCVLQKNAVESEYQAVFSDCLWLLYVKKPLDLLSVSFGLLVGLE